MGTITITAPSSGDAVTAASVANPLNTIKNEINGNLDNNNLKASANISWSKIAKTGSSLSEIADTDISSVAQGDILYRNGSSKWANLAAGSDGQYLKLTSGVPSWADSSTEPSGAIKMYGGSSAPSGYLLCYGQAVSRSNYSDLYTAIGTTFGAGDGSTTFNLPDLRGRFPLGKDDMGGTGADRVTNAQADSLGGNEGEENHTLTESEMPSHTHTIDLKASGDENNGTVSTGSSNDRTDGVTTSAGSDGAHNNMPPYLTLNYIIKT